MDTAKIREMIEAAVEDERTTGRLAKLVRDFAAQSGMQPTDEQVQQTIGFVREYIEHVPFYIEQGTAAARAAGLDAEMAQMTAELQAYWLHSEDLIADRLGLGGLMDDAYASLLLLQAVSDYCQATFGRALLPQNLTAANQAMQRMIGPPAAPQLEARVGITIGQALLQRTLRQFAMQSFQFGNTPDPIWGNASVDDIVKTRLGAMGIF